MTLRGRWNLCHISHTIQSGVERKQKLDRQNRADHSGSLSFRLRRELHPKWWVRLKAFEPCEGRCGILSRSVKSPCFQGLTRFFVAFILAAITIQKVV